MATPKLKLGNDKWATKQRSLLAFNDEGNNFKSLPFNVERLSGGSYVGRNGLVQYAASEEPRIDFTNYSKGALLLEPQRTNLKTNSEAVNNWTQSNISTSTNQTTAPDGSTNADKIIENSGSGSHKVYEGVSTTSGQVYTWSVFLKSDTRSKVRLNIFGAYAEFDVTNQTLLTQSGITSYKIEDYGNGWGRFSITETANASSTLTYVYLLNDNGSVSYTGDGSSGLFVWGGQLEQGSYSTSYISTAGSAATRVQEFIENRYTGLSSASGTVFIHFDTEGFDFSFAKIIALRDTATGDSLRLEPFDSSGVKKFAFFGINGFGATPPSEDILPIGTAKKIALTFDSGNFKYASNGVITTGTYSGTARQYNQIGGANITGGAMHNGIIQDFRIYDEVLTDAELQTLTTL